MLRAAFRRWFFIGNSRSQRQGIRLALAWPTQPAFRLCLPKRRTPLFHSARQVVPLLLSFLCGGCEPAALTSVDRQTDHDSQTLATVATAAARGFIHPGVLVSRRQLDFVKARLAAKADPWRSALVQVQKSPLASLSYRPQPRATVECGSYSMPDYGCSDEKNDAAAAYTHALLWFYLGSDAHARKSTEILNAWAKVLKSHTNSNAPLQAAWSASVFVRAAEIMAHTDSSWPSAERKEFSDLLVRAFLPLIKDGSAANGNWELSMTEALVGIAVFREDRALFDDAVAMWRARVPAYLYLSKDGPTPVPPPTGRRTGSVLVDYWYGQTRLVDGLSQETCRDLEHVQLGLAALGNAAETARIQGEDLFLSEKDRIKAGYEFHAKYLQGASVPSWLCKGKLEGVDPKPMWELGHSELSNRLGLSLPQTRDLLPKVRPTRVDHHMVWESLTHAELTVF